MKFLIIQKVKRDVPLERWAKLLPLQFKYFENLEKDKTLDLYYHLIGQQGSMLIVNAESDEKLSRVIGQDPMFFECEREVYPLTTRQTHEKQIRELLGHRQIWGCSMGCHGGFSIDEATRRSWYNPEAVLASLEDGMTFVDVGCGDGFFTILAAKKVGANGRVYAVDIDASNVEKLQKKAEAEKLTNVVVAVGRAEDTVFCQECADIVFYSMDLHDFDDPAKVLENARLMVKPWGKVIDLDWKKIEMEFGPPVEIRFSEQHVADMLQTAGFCSDVQRAGPYHYIVSAKPKHTL